MLTRDQLLEPLARRRTDEVVVTTMGVTRPWGRLSDHDLDFASADSAMGHAADLALGIALAQPQRRVLCLNGDGSMLMSLGTLATIAGAGAVNLVLFVVQNGTFEITGNQPLPSAGSLDFAAMARAAGFTRTYRFDDAGTYEAHLDDVLGLPGPTLVDVLVQPGDEGPIQRSETEQARYLRTSLKEWSHRMRAALLAVVAAFLFVACQGGEADLPSTPLAVRDSLQRTPLDFVAETTLVAWVERAARAGSWDDETRAELELLRLRTIDRVARLPEVDGFNPYHALVGVPDPPPGLRAWTEARSADIVFSEPAASWFVPSDVFWSLHDRFAHTRTADEIAADAMRAGFPGECEGFAGCYLESLLEMAGRYLETHPAGAHRAEALESVRGTLEAIDALDADQPLCGDERTSQGVEPAQLERLRAALIGANAVDTESGSAALAALERLAMRCRA